MKTALLLLAVAMDATGQTLNVKDGLLSAEGFPADIPVQVYASVDLQHWEHQYELAAQSSVQINGGDSVQFFRAAVGNPLRIELTSPTSVTGPVYRATGRVYGGILSRLSINGFSAEIKHHEFGLVNGRAGLLYVEWAQPITVTNGPNTFSITAESDMGVKARTNFTVSATYMPIVPIFPDQGAMITSEKTAIYGYADVKSNTVQIVSGSKSYDATIGPNGDFAVFDFPVEATNRVRIVAGTNELLLTFFRGPVTVTYSGVMIADRATPFSVTGTISDTNYAIRIGTQTITPDASGLWKLKTAPPENGVLPYSVVPRTNTSNAAPNAVAPANSGGVITAYTSTGWYISSHAEAFSYTYTPGWDPSHVYSKTYQEAYTGGNVSLNIEWVWDPYYPHIQQVHCGLSYSGAYPRLWLDEDAYPYSYCNYIQDSRIYPVSAEFANYRDSFIDRFYLTDSMTVSAASGCALHIGGAPGSHRLYRCEIQIVVDSTSRTGWTGDEMDIFEEARSNVLSSVGGHSCAPDGTVIVNAYENTNIDITPFLGAFNTGWYTYDVAVSVTEVTSSL